MEKLVNMVSLDGEEDRAIAWNGRIYVPYCEILESNCGRQLGIVNNNENDKVYEFKGYSIKKWIINNDDEINSIRLFKEKNEKEIPEGLKSEYEWNN